MLRPILFLSVMFLAVAAAIPLLIWFSVRRYYFTAILDALQQTYASAFSGSVVTIVLVLLTPTLTALILLFWHRAEGRKEMRVVLSGFLALGLLVAAIAAFHLVMAPVRLWNAERESKSTAIEQLETKVANLAALETELAESGKLYWVEFDAENNEKLEEKGKQGRFVLIVPGLQTISPARLEASFSCRIESVANFRIRGEFPMTSNSHFRWSEDRKSFSFIINEPPISRRTIIQLGVIASIEDELFVTNVDITEQ